MGSLFFQGPFQSDHRNIDWQHTQFSIFAYLWVVINIESRPPGTEGAVTVAPEGAGTIAIAVVCGHGIFGVAYSGHWGSPGFYSVSSIILRKTLWTS